MTKVVRFFHIRHDNAPKGGATVRVEGDDERGLEGEIEVCVSMCSPKDQFCRKTGREEAVKNRVQVMPLKGLAGKLHRVAMSVLKRAKGTGVRDMTVLGQRDYSFATKYFGVAQTTEEVPVTVRRFSTMAERMDAADSQGEGLGQPTAHMG